MPKHVPCPVRALICYAVCVSVIHACVRSTYSALHFGSALCSLCRTSKGAPSPFSPNPIPSLMRRQPPAKRHKSAFCINKHRMSDASFGDECIECRRQSASLLTCALCDYY